MTILEQFKAADKKVTEIENNGGLYCEGYGGVKSTIEYDKAIEEAQRLHNELISLGINPF